MSPLVSLLARYDALDRALVSCGFPPTSPWWRRELERFLLSGRRRWVIRAGRRAGKSTTMCRLAVTVALFGDWTIAPGDRGVVALVSVSKDEAAGRLRTIKAILKALRAKFTEHGDEIELVKRPAVFKVIACTTEAAVGFTSIILIGDEMARWESRDTASNPARQVMASLRPTMATQPNAIEVVASSPWGTDDYHAELFEAGDTAHQIASFAPTWEANPTLSMEQTRELEPDSLVWAREYAAEPGQVLTQALDPADLVPCFGRAPSGSRTGGFVSTDASSLRGDAFAWIAGYTTSEGEIAVCEADGWEGTALRATNMDTIVGTLCTRARRWSADTVFGDQREEASLRSLFAQHDMGFTSYAWTEASKDAAVMRLRRLMRDRVLCLPNHEKLRRELTALRARLTPSGRTKYETNGLDYASALITLAHAVVDGRVAANDDDDCRPAFGGRSDRGWDTGPRGWTTGR